MKINNKPIKKESIDNFYSKIIVQKNGCHIWSGYVNTAGYGRLRINGALILAHRLAMILAGKIIPDGYFVCHHCDSSACCNSDHLYIGTSADNMKDMAAKGRSRNSSGKNNPMYGKFGKKHPAYGHKHTEEFKKKLSLLKKGKPNLSVMGEKNSKAKLKKGHILYIRNSKLTGVELAKKFNVGTSVISDIRNRKIWRHIEC
jgi:hypothetical protein